MNRRQQLLAVNRWFWKGPCQRLATVGLVLCGSSCSSVSQYVKSTFQREKPPVAANDDAEVPADAKPAYAAARKDATPGEALAQVAPSPAGAKQDAAAVTPAAASQSSTSASAATPPSSENVLAMINKGQDPFAASGVQQASSEQPQTPQGQPAANPFTETALAEKPAPAADPASSATIQHANEPREPLSGQLAAATPNFSQACPPTAPCSNRPFPGPEVAGDEYVCDGGDKQEPVHYEGLNRAGLNPEDTIAEFKDDTGKVHMQPSTQTCVYAPRFGAVSSATVPQQDLSINRAAGHQDQAAVAGLETKTVIDEKTQTDEALGVRMRARASGIENKQADDQMEQALAARNHVKLVNVNEDFRFIQEGQFDLVDHAVISEGMLAAHEWADGRRPVIVANDQSGQIVQGRFTAQDYTGVEDRRTPGELKLIKVADRAAAHPGDIITFTIRFDNVGGKDLFSVRVVDNLSPRLEYIENSISSDRNGKITTADNGVGGKLLTFEFDEPLKGQSGGYVSFQCKVR